MILSEQTFIELAGKQEVLDAKIKQAKGITDLPLRRIELYFRIELAECLNELKGDFKHWSNKPMRRVEFIEELVDALHFYLSYVNHMAESYDAQDDMPGYYQEEYRYLEEGYHFYVDVLLDDEERSLKETPKHEIAISIITDMNLYNSFAKLLYLAECYGYTEKDIIDTYNRKNAVNHDRSDSGVY